MIKKQIKKCPRCSVDLIEEYFADHLKTECGKYYEDEPDYDYDDSINDVDFLQKNLDATKDYGYPCRESGSYGSLSGYDGFDDESEA